MYMTQPPILLVVTIRTARPRLFSTQARHCPAARAISTIGRNNDRVMIHHEKAQIAEPCPVCGYCLDFRPWTDLSAADEMCPCCGIQFGYDDVAGGNIKKRQGVYLSWRRRWIEAGMPWKSKGRKSPQNWDPSVQLARIKY